MKISEVIAELQKIQEEHGDLRVLANNEYGTASTVCEGDIYSRRLLPLNSNSEKVVEIDV